MTDLDHILDRGIPRRTRQVGLELSDRRKTPHALSLAWALCTLGFQAQVGQAGIGDINQVQVSNDSPVSQDAIGAQPPVAAFHP